MIKSLLKHLKIKLRKKKKKKLQKKKGFAEEIKEREEEIKQEMKKIKKSSIPQDKEAAEARVAQRNEELARLQTQIAERVAFMSQRGKIKEIFKKHGLTVTAIFLAAGQSPKL